MKLDRDIMRKLPLALRVEIEENALRKALTQSELAVEQRRIIKELRKHTRPGNAHRPNLRGCFPGGIPEPRPASPTSWENFTVKAAGRSKAAGHRHGR